MAFFSCDRTCCVSVLLGPIAHFGVRCVVFQPDMHVLIVTYHAPTPEAADAGPLLSGRVSQVSTMTLDALIPRRVSLWSVSGCTSRGCTSSREFVSSCATGDGTFGWSNAT